PAVGSANPGDAVGLSGLRLEVAGPPVFPVEQDRDPPLWRKRTGDRTQPLKLGPKRLHLAEDAAVVDGHVRHERTVELLRAGLRRTPLEEQDPIGPARDRLQTVKPHEAGALWAVHRPPVHRAGRLLHQDPGTIGSQGTGDVVADRRPVTSVRLVERIRIAVPRGEIHLTRPLEVVERTVEGHEVGGDRDVWRHLPKDRGLHAVALEKRIAREASEIEPLGRVAVIRCAAWRQSLVSVTVGPAPDWGSPCGIGWFDRTVAPPQPLPNRVRSRLVVAFEEMAGVLVVDVPADERRMFAIALG